MFQYKMNTLFFMLLNAMGYVRISALEKGYMRKYGKYIEYILD